MCCASTPIAAGRAERHPLTCEFLRTPAGEHIGIAVETARVAPLIAGLQTHGLAPRRITLDVLMQGVQREGTRLWCDYDHLVVLRCQPRGIEELAVCRLRSGPDRHAWVARAVAKLEGFELPGAIAGGRVPAEWLRELRNQLHLADTPLCPGSQAAPVLNLPTVVY